MNINHVKSPISTSQCNVSRAAYYVISGIMILSVIFKIPPVLDEFTDMQLFGFTEFLINFQGGFVRRGLLGELIYQLNASTGIHPTYLVGAICIVSYVAVAGIFIKCLTKRGYSWWVVFSPILFGLIECIVRKDFLLILCLCGIIYLLRKVQLGLKDKLLAFALMIFGLFLHEAFIFWGGPIYFLLLITSGKDKKTNILLTIIPLVVFAVLCRFHGDAAIANAIIDSWNSVLDGEPLRFYALNSIGALSWDAWTTFYNHLKINVQSYYGYLGLIYWPVFFAVIYYFVTFMFDYLKKKDTAFSDEDRACVSLLLIIEFICMLPLWLFLSCDYGRLIQSMVAGTLAVFIIVDRSRLHRLFPAAALKKVMKLNKAISNTVTPSRGLIIFLLLTIGTSASMNPAYFTFLQSPLFSASLGVINCIKSLFV